jgi:hypothetical protein
MEACGQLAIIMDKMSMVQPPIRPATSASPLRTIDMLHEIRSLSYQKILGMKLLTAEIDFENSLKHSPYVCGIVPWSATRVEPSEAIVP